MRVRFPSPAPGSWLLLIFGDLVTVESGVVFRYSAHIGNGTDIGEMLFYGVEALTIRDDKILTVSNFYCSSDKKELEKIARLSLRRHGQSMYASEGFGAKGRLLLEVSSPA